MSNSYNELPEDGLGAEAAYDLVHEELRLDGDTRQNLATFTTTYMEPEAERLMAETQAKNLVNKHHYRATAALEERCIKMLAHLYHAPVNGDERGPCGACTVGSSEAVMLAGLALKKKWQQRARRHGAPNLILSNNAHVAWAKFCRYWEVEPRWLPLSPDRITLGPDQVLEATDDDTIGVVTTLGLTYTGQYEPIKAIHDALFQQNAATGRVIPIHVDAASGGFVAPFLKPELEWDFRLPLVHSINVSGHKYGLVYPSVGWVIWRTHLDLPEDMIFHVTYLGREIPTFTLNFSRPASQLVAQYYNFVRLGRAGYRRVMLALRNTAVSLATELGQIPELALIAEGSDTPVIALCVSAEAPLSAFELSYKLRESGWHIPAYTLPPHADAITLMRIVIREGFTRDLATMLLADIRRAVAHPQ